MGGSGEKRGLEAGACMASSCATTPVGWVTQTWRRLTYFLLALPQIFPCVVQGRRSCSIDLQSFLNQGQIPTTMKEFCKCSNLLLHHLEQPGPTTSFPFLAIFPWALQASTPHLSFLSVISALELSNRTFGLSACFSRETQRQTLS